VDLTIVREVPVPKQMEWQDAASRHLAQVPRHSPTNVESSTMTDTHALPDVDVVVVGGGPAGLSAAIWAARHRRTVLLVDAGEQRNLATVETHGYLGFDHAAPGTLLDRAREDVRNYAGIVVRHTSVTTARPERVADVDRFAIELGDGSTVSAARVILATGTVDEYPPIADFEQHFGADVFTCPSCDGYEARGRHAVVIGGGPHIAQFALGLYDWAASVTVVTAGLDLELSDDQIDALVSHGIRIVDDTVTGIIGPRGAMSALRLSSGEEIDASRAFFSLAVRPRTDLATMLGCALADDGTIEVDRHHETSVAGVYAAGDAIAQVHLVQVAAGSGAVAGVSAAMSLRGELGARSSPIPAPDPASAAT
jgi:thioredoxin reductase